eukprot:TRINITY_DN90_c1_g1_i2.p1 TRINITY_DN90_c1_g1~~TRINITY_DN90_c1_g1_i2.p1  ORF type:complete len:721 (-),score=219.97 TRINITY_DN90_c1_g1_i2:32-2194(-)
MHDQNDGEREEVGGSSLLPSDSNFEPRCLPLPASPPHNDPLSMQTHFGPSGSVKKRRRDLRLSVSSVKQTTRPTFEDTKALLPKKRRRDLRLSVSSVKQTTRPTFEDTKALLPKKPKMSSLPQETVSGEISDSLLPKDERKDKKPSHGSLFHISSPMDSDFCVFPLARGTMKHSRRKKVRKSCGEEFPTHVLDTKSKEKECVVSKKMGKHTIEVHYHNSEPKNGSHNDYNEHERIGDGVEGRVSPGSDDGNEDRDEGDDEREDKDEDEDGDEDKDKYESADIDEIVVISPDSRVVQKKHSGLRRSSARSLTRSSVFSPEDENEIVDMSSCLSEEWERLRDRLGKLSFPLACGKLILTKSDVMKLLPGNMLNDSVIAFYSEYLMKEHLIDGEHSMFYIFSTHFSTLLSTGFDRIHAWTRKITPSVLERDILFIPVFREEYIHFILIAVFSPSSDCPRICAFDSLGRTRKNLGVFKNIKEWLSQEREHRVESLKEASTDDDDRDDSIRDSDEDENEDEGGDEDEDEGGDKDKDDDRDDSIRDSDEDENEDEGGDEDEDEGGDKDKDKDRDKDKDKDGDKDGDGDRSGESAVEGIGRREAGSLHGGSITVNVSKKNGQEGDADTRDADGSGKDDKKESEEQDIAKEGFKCTVEIATVPIQRNGCDCGVYVLQFMEKIVEEFEKEGRFDSVQKPDWFDQSLIERKREELCEIILSKHEKQNTSS